VDVVLPQQCAREQEDPVEIRECGEMAKDLWGVELDGKRVEYPTRYQLDIASNKRWYDAQGVRQTFVIVVRDDGISFEARRDHCDNATLREWEERVGTELIVDAINAFVLKDDDEKATRKTLKHWVASQYQGTDTKTRMLTALPSGEGVVVVSYESLVKLGNTYVKMMYEALGIESDVYPPDIRDSNEKYLRSGVGP